MIAKSQITDAIARLKSQSSEAIRVVKENAARLGASELVDACDDELRIRGNANIDTDQAALAAKYSEMAADMTLQKIVEIAFTEIPASDYEVRLLRVIQSNPGAPYSEIERIYGKKDAALAAGHLVYDRYGFFRQFMDLEKDQSSILLIKEKSANGVTWALKPDVEKTFQSLGILKSP